MGLTNGPVADCRSPFYRHNVVILSLGQTVPEQGMHHGEIEPTGPDPYRPFELHTLTCAYSRSLPLCSIPQDAYWIGRY